MKFFQALMSIVIITGVWGCAHPARIMSAVGNTISISFSDGYGEQEAANKAQRYCQLRGRNAELIMRSGMSSGVITIDYRCVE